MTAGGAPPAARRRLLALVTGLLLVAGPALAGCGDSTPARGGPIEGPNGADLYGGAGNVWHEPLPAGAPIDPRSADYVRQLLKQKPLVSVNGWTVPVYDADAGTRRYRVTATEEFVSGGWTLPAVPIPDAAVPDGREDGHMVVVDRTAGCVYEFWQAVAVSADKGGGWTAGWVNATPVDGTGVYPDGLAARGSGLSVAAGLIWPQELAAGRIDHALLFASPFTTSDAVPPATTTDGRNRPGITGLPVGARLRLDPSVDLDALALSPEQRTIAVALQQYGMILGDTSGGFTLFAAEPRSYTTFPYPATWANDTYADISAIPFDKLQVLTLPAATGRKPPAPVLNRCTQDAVHGEGTGPGTRGPDDDDDD